ncbi:MAG: FtsW/RodA/SpoVE family cell cycle protein [Eubacteriales bacterium]
MLKRYQLRNYNFKLILYVIAITIVGILVIGSAEETVQDKQMLGFIVGFFLMILISLFDYSFFLKFYWVIYVFNLTLLVLVQMYGDTTNNAQRWIEVVGVRFQPSETAKIMLILFFAQFIVKHHAKISTLRMICVFIALFIPPVLLIYKQPDLSTSILIALIFITLLFIGGISYKIVIGVLLVLVPSFLIFLALVVRPTQDLIADYQRDRIMAWLHPEDYRMTIGYQQSNSMMAIGSGQLYGKGLYNNEIASVKNGDFIPEPQTDFIFAIIGEELGFMGACITIALILGILFECLMIARSAKDLEGTLIASGIAALIGFQSIINISVTVGLFPNTGIPLPFVSYGLTSLVSILMGVGFVLNIGLQRKRNY